MVFSIEIPEKAGDHLTPFAHADVPLGLVFREGKAEVVHESMDVLQQILNPLSPRLPQYLRHNGEFPQVMGVAEEDYFALKERRLDGRLGLFQAL